MAGYNVQGDLLAQGINCVVRVDPDDESGSNPLVVGFVSTATIRKNLNVQRAAVIGEILTASIDVTGVQVTVNLQGFVPSKGLVTDGIESARGGGKVHLKSFNSDTSKLIDKRIITKIPYLDIYDEKHKCIIGYAEWLTPTSYSDSINGKGYVQADCGMEGITYENGTDYPASV